METPETVRAFWFGEHADDAEAARSQAGLWWAKSEQTDEAIRSRFGELVVAAGQGRLCSWLASPGGRLALILLTDQFTRNIYRGKPEAFAFDAAARRWCLEGLRAGADRGLRPVERVFFYLPLEHSEERDHQEQSVQLFTALAEQVRPEWQEVFGGFLDFARQHLEIIARFGRFPHRTEILGRVSTDDELAFLEKPGSSF